MADPFIQRLVDTGITIEQATERAPDRTRFHVYEGERLVGSFKRLADAQIEFRRLRDESGWTPPTKPELTPEEMLVFDREMLQRNAYMEYWSNSHKFRGGGRPKRK